MSANEFRRVFWPDLSDEEWYEMALALCPTLIEQLPPEASPKVICMSESSVSR